MASNKWLAPLVAGVTGAAAGVLGSLLMQGSRKKSALPVALEQIDVMNIESPGHIYLYPGPDRDPLMGWVDSAMLYRLSETTDGASYGRNPGLRVEGQWVRFELFERFKAPEQIGRLFSIELHEENQALRLMQIQRVLAWSDLIIAEKQAIVMHLELLEFGNQGVRAR